MKQITTSVAAVSLSLIIAGCATPTKIAPVKKDNIQPANYVQQIQASLQANLIDPDSLKAFKIVKPLYKATCRNYISRLSTVVPVEYWTAVVSYNAKNKMGGYTGAETYRYYFQEGQIKTARQSTLDDDIDCPSQVW